MEYRFTKAAGAALLASAALAQHAAAGPLSPYYLASGDRIFAVQGSDVLWNQPTFYSTQEYAIAVPSTIRTTGFSFNQPGGEYLTDTGAPTGTSYPHPGKNDFNDGATDGKIIFGAQFSTGDVYAFDANWGNPVLLFSTGKVEDILGITYDPADGSLWISGWGSAVVENYSLDGVLNSSFATPFNKITALALDPASGSLWMGSQTTPGTYHEYDRLGNAGGTEFYAAIGGANTLGGEFAVPAPGAAALLGVAGIVAARRRR